MLQINYDTIEIHSLFLPANYLASVLNWVIDTVMHQKDGI